MPRSRSKYAHPSICEADLVQAMAWLDERVSGTTFDIRTHSTKQRPHGLRVVLAGYPRVPGLGKAGRQIAQAFYPTSDGRSLLSVMYGLVYTLADHCEAPVTEAIGRYTELVPGFSAKKQ